MRLCHKRTLSRCYNAFFFCLLGRRVSSTWLMANLLMQLCVNTVYSGIVVCVWLSSHAAYPAMSTCWTTILWNPHLLHEFGNSLHHQHTCTRTHRRLSILVSSLYSAEAACLLFPTVSISHHCDSSQQREPIGCPLSLPRPFLPLSPCLSQAYWVSWLIRGHWVTLEGTLEAGVQGSEVMLVWGGRSVTVRTNSSLGERGQEEGGRLFRS